MKALILNCDNQYGILSHFVEGIVQDLAIMGISSEVFSMSDEVRHTLNSSGKHVKEFDFCISINAIGLDLNIDGGGMFTDFTGKPTLVMLVDHPIHLISRYLGKKVTLLCVDQEHVVFANLLGHEAHYFPHAVASTNSKKYQPVHCKDKTNEILFPVSYFPIEKWQDLLTPLWGKLGNAIENAESVTRFMQFIGVLPYGEKPSSTTLEQSVLTICKAVDFYLRAKSRMHTLRLYEEAGIQLTVVGHGSAKYQAMYPSHKYESALHIDKLLIRIQQAKFLAHNSPGFQRGLHDRLVLPMNLGTAVLCHNAPVVNTVFNTPGGVITEISKQSLQISDKDYQQMCLSNHHQLQQSHTWQQRFKQLLG